MTTQEQLDEAARSVCMPVTLLINFSLFQYLFTLYYKRRREYHGLLLLLCAFVGFAALVPFASRRRGAKISGHLNDISETASTIMLLVQIVIESRDATRKTRIPSVRVALVVAELFTLLEIIVLLLLVAVLIAPTIDSQVVDSVHDGVQDAALAFIFASRFYFLLKERGWMYLRDHKKFEIAVYLLFTTHHYPFALLETKTGLVWEPVEAMWHRLILVLCLSSTIREKLRASSVMSQHKATLTPNSAHHSTRSPVVACGPNVNVTTLAQIRVLSSLKGSTVTSTVSLSSPSVKAITAGI